MDKSPIFKTFDQINRQTPKLLSDVQINRRDQLKSAQMLRPTTVSSRSRLKINLSNPKFKIFESPEKNCEKLEVFPKWLMERPDFRQSLTSSADQNDIAKICSKPFKQRDAIEKYTLLNWFKSVSYFATLSEFTSAEVCEKLSTVFFRKGETVLNKGETGDKMFIIVKGLVGIYNTNSNECIDVVGPSNTIGEIAIEFNTKRNATAVAHDNLSVLLLKKEDFDNIVMRQKHKQRYVIVNFLKNIPFFKELLAAKVEVIAWNMITVKYSNNQIIFLEGQNAHSLYFVKEGTVNLIANVTITNKNYIPTAKKETLVEKKTYQKIIKACAVGDFFGEEELICEVPRKARAVCIGKTEIYLLKKEFVDEIFSDKEKQEMLKIHEKIPTGNEMKKIIRKNILNKKLKINTMLDAVSMNEPNYLLKSSKSQRDIRKKNFLASGIWPCKDDEDQILLNKEIFFLS